VIHTDDSIHSIHTDVWYYRDNGKKTLSQCVILCFHLFLFLSTLLLTSHIPLYLFICFKYKSSKFILPNFSYCESCFHTFKLLNESYISKTNSTKTHMPILLTTKINHKKPSNRCHDCTISSKI
jgi:hypothetical protein